MAIAGKYNKINIALLKLILVSSLKQLLVYNIFYNHFTDGFILMSFYLSSIDIQEFTICFPFSAQENNDLKIQL